jgi:GNAT superfamily N-acetyltransferase
MNIRFFRIEDIDWIIQLHGTVYAEEYNWDETFEALVAEILDRFMQHHDPYREQIWIAELEGERVGTVMIVDAGNQVAQLRLLLVEPRARNKGIGKQLIMKSMDFAKKRKYQKMILWTQSILNAAHHLYKNAGFRRIAVEPHHSFGHDLVGETWELSLEDGNDDSHQMQ